jgi:hypothetical protein
MVPFTLTCIFGLDFHLFDNPTYCTLLSLFYSFTVPSSLISLSFALIAHNRVVMFPLSRSPPTRYNDHFQNPVFLVEMNYKWGEGEQYGWTRLRRSESFSSFQQKNEPSQFKKRKLLPKTNVEGERNQQIPATRTISYGKWKTNDSSAKSNCSDPITGKICFDRRETTSNRNVQNITEIQIVEK